MKNRKQTSDRIAELAGKTLGDAHASQKSKALAGSALAQTASATAAVRQRHARSARQRAGT